jgi:hypothetical protein
MNTKKNFISQIMVTIMFAITFLITGQCFGADDGNYDPATHTLWQLISANQQGYGEFYSVWAMRFTKKGWIQIVMVLKAEQYPECQR